jgi:hypothetical protein
LENSPSAGRVKEDFRNTAPAAQGRTDLLQSFGRYAFVGRSE